MEEELIDSIRQSLLCLLEETLHSHKGVYTNERTSLLETLAKMDADLASRRFTGLPQTIAGHVNHAKSYLSNTIAMLRGEGTGDFDVAASWSVETVNAQEWERLQSALAKTYHLGAIRQLKDLPP